MVRKWERKSARGSYGSETLKAALGALEIGQSLKSTAKQFKIPKTTLRRHMKGQVRNPGEVKLGRYVVSLNEEYEKSLVDYIQDMERAMMGITPLNVRMLAFELAEKMNIPHSFNREKKCAGKDWFMNFMARWPQLSVRRPIGTSLNRQNSFTKEAISIFFENLEKKMTELKIDQSRINMIWNADETGVSTVVDPGKIVATKGIRQVRKITSGERGSNITAVVAMNPLGSFIPPLFVFPRKRMNDRLMFGAPYGAVGEVNDRGTGYIDSVLFPKYLEHFAKYANCSKERPCILILDGHESHKTIDAIEVCRRNGISIITLPPHTSHRTQPLDRTFFKILKSKYKNGIDAWMVANRGKVMFSVYDVVQTFAAAYDSSCTNAVAKAGFSAAGIWPFNPSKFDTEFEESTPVATEGTVPDRTATTNAEDAGQPADQPSTTTPVHQAFSAENKNAFSANPENSSLPTEKPPSAPVQQTADPTTDSQHPSSSRGLHDVPVAGKSTNNRAQKSYIDKDVIDKLFQEISPPPQQRKTTKTKTARKRTKSEIITSTQYKKQLEQELENRGKKKARKVIDFSKNTNKENTNTSKGKGIGKKMPQKSQPRQKVLSDYDKNLENPLYYCGKCKGYYYDDDRADPEDWIECPLCKQAYHETCAGVHGKSLYDFVCDECTN